MAFEFEVNLKDGVSGPASSASDSVRGLSSSFDKSAAAAAQPRDEFGRFTKAADTAGGAAEDAGGSMGGLQEELAEMTGGLSVAIEALGAFALGAGAAVVAGAMLAIEMSDAREDAEALFDALGAGVSNGKEAIAMFDRLGEKIGKTRGELSKWAQSYEALGITDLDQLESKLTATASAQAMMGDKGAAAFEKLTKKIQTAAQTGQALKIPVKGLGSLADVGLQVDDVAKQLGITTEQLASQLKAGTVDATKFGAALDKAVTAKGAGPLANNVNDLSTSIAKAKEYFGQLFEDVDPGPFLAEVKDLIGIFSKGNASGKAMSTAITGYFNILFKQAAKVVPIIKHFLLDMVIWGLKAYIGLKPIVKGLQDIWAENDGATKLAGIMSSLWTVIKAVALVVAAVVIFFVALWAAGMALGLAIWVVIGACISLANDAGEALLEWVNNAADSAKNFIKGLVAGISNGAGAVVDAVKGLAGGAKEAFKGALGIKSPSKVMMEAGINVTKGVVGGIEAGTPDVAAAADDLGNAAAGGMGGGGGSGGGGKSTTKGGLTVIVQAGAIVIEGAGKAADELTETAVALLFERIALAEGLGDG